jgi:hypothetical protein
MSGVLKFEQRKPPAIDPDLKDFIDRVIVPILVRDFLEVHRAEKPVAQSWQSVAPYTQAKTALAEKVAT